MSTALQIALQLVTSNRSDAAPSSHQQNYHHHQQHFQSSSHMAATSERGVGGPHHVLSTTKCMSYGECLSISWKELSKVKQTYSPYDTPRLPYDIPHPIASFNFMPPPRPESFVEEPECTAPRRPRDVNDLSQKMRRRSALTTSGRSVQRSLMSNLSLRRPEQAATIPARRISQASPFLSRESSMSDARLLNAGLNAFGNKIIKSPALLVWRGLRVRVGLHTGVRYATDIVYSEVSDDAASHGRKTVGDVL